jgi:hypothetical protein
MVTRPRANAQSTKDEFWDKKFDATRKFLSDFGISPRNVDEYAEEEVLRAIHRRGWEDDFKLEVDPPGWKAEIREWRHLTQSQAAIGRDPDRMMALLRALRLALTWPTLDEELQAFDQQTQMLLGISAKEFLDRLYNGGLSADDPRVTHLMITRPLGT